MSFINKFIGKPDSILISIITFMLGLFLIIFPETSKNIFSLILGIFMLFLSLTSLFTLLKLKKQGYNFSKYTFSSILYGILSIICLFFSNFIFAFLPIIMGSFFLIIIFSKLTYIINIIKNKNKFSVICSIFYFIILILSILLLLNPFSSIKYFIIFLGLTFLLNSLADLFSNKN